MADDSIISYGDLIGDDGTFKQLSKDIEKLEKELLDLAKATKKAFKSVNPNDAAQIEKLEKQVKELTQANKNLAKAQEVVAKAQKKVTEQTEEELIKREALKIEKREATRIAKQQAIILKEEGNTIKSLRAQLSLITIQWSKATAENIKYNQKVKGTNKTAGELVETKKKLTEQLKELEKQTGDNRRNVGNYSDALKGNEKITQRLSNQVKKLRKDFLRVFVGRTIIDGIKRLGGAFGDLVTKFRDSNEIIGGIGGAFDRASNALQFAGVRILEFLAPAIERVANLISDLPAFFAGVGAAAAQFASNTKSQFSNLGNSIKIFGLQAKRAITFDDDEVRAIDTQIAAIEQRIQDSVDSRLGITEAFDKAFRETKDAQADFAAQQAKAEQEEADKKKREERKRIQERLQQERELRIRAIEQLNKELRKLETDNIKEAQERELELEKLRFKEEKELKKQQLDELSVFFKDNEEKLLEIENLRRKLSEEQEEKHQQNILDIRKRYAIQTAKIEAIDITKQQQEETKVVIKGLDEINEKEKKNAKERSERLIKQKEEQQALIQQIGETANKIGQEVVNLLEKQADLAKDNVNEQVDNLDRARERAAQGLESNIAFEEKELARRQAEQQQKEKQAQQAAKILSLFNLVSAYAASGDENALFRGLADFAILEAIGAGLQGFYEGTEDTGTVANALDNKGGRLAILHNNERVVTKAQNMLLGGMSNDELVQNALIGSHMSDSFGTMSATKINAFKQQQEEFVKSMAKEQNKDNSTQLLIKEVKALRSDIRNQPNMSYELEKLYEGLYGLVKTEQRDHYKKIQRQKLKPRF